MAFGESGSSFSTDCSTRRRGGLPASLQLLREGLASRLNQVSSKNPTTHSGRPSARRINQSLAKLAFFSCVLGVRRGYPAFGPLPAHPHPLQSGPDGFAADAPLCEPL